jgi:hypothetical protein
MAEKTVRTVLAQMSKTATQATERKIGFLRFFSSEEKELKRIKSEKEKVLKNLTPMERKMTEFLAKNPFGCNNNKVIELESIRAGKQLPVEDLEDNDCDDDDEPNLGKKFRENDVQFLTMFVPLIDHEHNYPLGKPCLSVQDPECDEPIDYMLRLTGGTGGEMDNHIGIMRTAMPEEIDHFFATVSTRDLKEHVGREVSAVEAVLGKKLGAPKKKPAKKKPAKKKPAKKKSAKPVKKAKKKKAPRKKAAKKKKVAKKRGRR